MYEFNGVQLYLSLLDLRSYMCNSRSWHEAVEIMSHHVCEDSSQLQSHWIDGLYWLMGTHARIWERKGWSFEPDLEVFEWL